MSTNKTAECVIRKFLDNRLMLVVLFKQSSNFWIHPDGTCSWVPKIEAITHIIESIHALDTYNKLKKNLESLKD